MAILAPSSVPPQAGSACTGPLSASFWNPGTPITRILCIRKRTSVQKKDGKSTPEAEPGDFVAFQIMTVTDVWRRLIRSHKHDR